MNTLRQWMRVWRLLRASLAEPAPLAWRPEDAAALRGWFESPAGARLRRHMRRAESRACAEAVLRQSGAEWTCGYASGLRAGFAWLQSLASDLPPDEDPPGAGAALDRFSP